MANSALDKHNTSAPSGITMGLDVGSTTAKIAVVKQGKLLFERYVRHFAKIRETLANVQD